MSGLHKIYVNKFTCQGYTKYMWINSHVRATKNICELIHMSGLQKIYVN